MRRIVPWALATLCAIALTAAGQPARAQKEDAAAKGAFTRGSKAFEKGDFAAAADAFREANRLKPSWKLLYNIGQAEAAAKRYGLALEAFERYLAEGGDDVATDRRDEVIAEVKRLRELVGSLEIQAPAGAVVFVDDFEHGAAPLPGAIKVAAGIDHVVRVERDGAVLASRTVRLSGGDTVTVELGVAKPEETPSSAPVVREPAGAADDAAEEGKRMPLVISGWVALGAGAAVAIAGGVVGGVALSKNKQLESDCPDAACGPAFHDDLATRDSLGVASTVLIAAGAAVAATGAVLLIIGHKKVEKIEGSGGAAEISMLPTAGPGFAGAALTGRF